MSFAEWKWRKEGLRAPRNGFLGNFGLFLSFAAKAGDGELRELFNGFWMLEVSSKEEAIEWAKRAPLGAGSQMEIRRVTGPEDFPQDNEWIQKEQQWIEEGRVGRG